jgi:outer membrane lipoprotein-sorting protein
MKRSKLFLALLLVVMVLAACAPQAATLPATPAGSQAQPTVEVVPEAVTAARQHLANQLSVALEDVKVIDFKQVDWTDGCLGLGGPAESCLAAITPGYSVTLEAGGKQVVYRTDLKGTAVRSETPEAN